MLSLQIDLDVFLLLAYTMLQQSRHLESVYLYICYSWCVCVWVDGVYIRTYIHVCVVCCI